MTPFPKKRSTNKNSWIWLIISNFFKLAAVLALFSSIQIASVLFFNIEQIDNLIFQDFFEPVSLSDLKGGWLISILLISFSLIFLKTFSPQRIKEFLEKIIDPLPLSTYLKWSFLVFLILLLITTSIFLKNQESTIVFSDFPSILEYDYTSNSYLLNSSVLIDNSFDFAPYSATIYLIGNPPKFAERIKMQSVSTVETDSGYLFHFNFNIDNPQNKMFNYYVEVSDNKGKKISFSPEVIEYEEPNNPSITWILDNDLKLEYRELLLKYGQINVQDLRGENTIQITKDTLTYRPYVSDYPHSIVWNLMVKNKVFNAEKIIFHELGYKTFPIPVDSKQLLQLERYYIEISR